MKILVLGDSITKGIVYDDIKKKYVFSDKSFVSLLKQDNLEIENVSLMGSTVTKGLQTLERLGSEVGNYDYTAIEFGGNDCDFNWAEIAENPDKEHYPKNTVEKFVEIYSRIIDEIRDLGKEPVLLSLPPIDSVRYFDFISRKINADNILKWLEGDRQLITNWHERYNLEVFKTALNKGIPVIDITSRFLETKNYSKLLCDDGIHPNEQGHAMIAETIMEYVKERKIKITD
mgnify:CR=1 FL=1